MTAHRDWKVYFAFSNQLLVTLVSFILGILLFAKKADIEANEMRFAVEGVPVQPYWVPLLAFGFFLHAGFSAGASVGVWRKSGWAIVLYGISFGLGALMFAMTILLTTFLGWIPAFLTLFPSIAIPPIFLSLVHRRFQSRSAQ